MALSFISSAARVVNVLPKQVFKICSCIQHLRKTQLDLNTPSKFYVYFLCGLSAPWAFGKPSAATTLTYTDYRYTQENGPNRLFASRSFHMLKNKIVCDGHLSNSTECALLVRSRRSVGRFICLKRSLLHIRGAVPKTLPIK
eukprot:3248933-Amphidinium_carterae.1